MRAVIGFALGFAGAVWGMRNRAQREADAEAQPQTDEQIRERVLGEWRRLGLLEESVDASIIDGVVYARGQARSSTADALIATARPIPGVTSVRDELQRI